MSALGVHLTFSVFLAVLLLVGCFVDKNKSPTTGLMFIWAVVQFVTALLIRFG